MGEPPAEVVHVPPPEAEPVGRAVRRRRGFPDLRGRLFLVERLQVLLDVRNQDRRTEAERLQESDAEPFEIGGLEVEIIMGV